MHFCTFDVTTDSRSRGGGDAAGVDADGRADDRGEEAFERGAVGLNPYAPPSDTGEALGLPPSQLTLTIGFGPDFFPKDGKDRFGIAEQRPELCWPTCPSSPTRPWIPPAAAATSASRPAPTTRRSPCTPSATWPGSRSARPRCGTRSSGSAVRRRPQDQSTPRNLFGFKDGTNNLKADETDKLNKHVWVADGDGPDWLTGGTYLVTRRIRMRIENWDRTTLLEQERVIGRQKGSGAPNGFTQEFDGTQLRLMRRQEDPADRQRRPRPAGARRNTSAASRSCAAATTSPTAQTVSATSTPGCSSSRSCGTRDTSFIPMQMELSGATRSTSTSPTPAPRYSRAPPGIRENDRRPTGVRRCSAERPGPVVRARRSPPTHVRVAPSARLASLITGSRTPESSSTASSGSPSSDSSARRLRLRPDHISVLPRQRRPVRPPLLLGDRAELAMSSSSGTSSPRRSRRSPSRHPDRVHELQNRRAQRVLGVDSATA